MATKEKVTRKEVSQVTPKLEKKTTVKKTGGLSVPVYSLLGKLEAGTMDLPAELFGAKVNKALLSQALRVYLNNQKGHFSNTKTRGQVEGSTRKIYAQKGTGRARHGGIRAPIFVGGGIALGPTTRKTQMDLPKKIKKAALISALSSKNADQGILGVSGFEKAVGKTKEMAKLITKIKNDDKRGQILIVTDKTIEMVNRSLRNIQGVDVMTATDINAYEVIAHRSLILTREAVETLHARLIKLDSKEEMKNTKIKKEKKNA